MADQIDSLHLAAFERMERRIENVLRDMRILRHELEKNVSEKGVLGSRSMTEYVLGLLQTEPYTITELLNAAEQAGYSIPTRRILSKRLTERKYRVGDLVYDSGSEKWSWKQE
jgi:hypothetical protein